MSGSWDANAAKHAAAMVRPRLGVERPRAAIVLGSGLGAFAERLERSARVPYGDIPGFAPTGVPGHQGVLLRGSVAGKEVLVFAGRFHLYEGHPAEAAAFPVRVAHALGVAVLVLTNAAGGVSPRFRAGDLMVIEDHINLTWRNPLIGTSRGTQGQEAGRSEPHFPAVSVPYAPRLIRLLHDSARDLGIPLASGVFAGLLGPSYETPAEVRMLAAFGADAVGMSTVVEAIAGAALGLEVVGASVITNAAAGLSGTPLAHSEVVETAVRAGERLGDLLVEFLRRL
jgi:purine-nucleoside phosphorylase